MYKRHLKTVLDLSVQLSRNLEIEHLYTTMLQLKRESLVTVLETLCVLV